MHVPCSHHASNRFYFIFLFAFSLFFFFSQIQSLRKTHITSVIQKYHFGSTVSFLIQVLPFPINPNFKLSRIFFSLFIGSVWLRGEYVHRSLICFCVPKMATMESLIGLVNKIQRACTVLGDYGGEGMSLWEALPSVAVVGGQVNFPYFPSFFFYIFLVFEMILCFSFGVNDFPSRWETELWEIFGVGKCGG